MTAERIVKPLIDKGFLLWLDGDRLRFKPRPDPATIETLRQHKASIVSYLTQRGPVGMAGVSEQGNAPEIVTTGTPENVPSADLEELWEERAAIMEYDGGMSRDEAEARAVLAYPCCCFGRRFWVSKYGAIRCAGCHPPADPGGVVRWVEIGEP